MHPPTSPRSADRLQVHVDRHARQRLLGEPAVGGKWPPGRVCPRVFAPAHRTALGRESARDAIAAGGAFETPLLLPRTRLDEAVRLQLEPAKETVDLELVEKRQPTLARTRKVTVAARANHDQRGVDMARRRSKRFGRLARLHARRDLDAVRCELGGRFLKQARRLCQRAGPRPASGSCVAVTTTT